MSRVESLGPPEPPEPPGPLPPESLPLSGSSAEVAETDLALQVTLPQSVAEDAGALLMEVFGPFEEAAVGERVRLTFYPAGSVPSSDDVLALLPEELRRSGSIEIEMADVDRGWADGWKDHFRPIVIKRVRIRPPWESEDPTGIESPVDGERENGPSGWVEVVINPGLGFGTGLHPTTRGTLRLLQDVAPEGPLLDAGTGSGVLAIAAAKLGWSPVVAFDNDPVALVSARENVEVNGVGHRVTLLEMGVEYIAAEFWAGATVLANMTLEPVLALLARLATADPPVGRPRRLVVSGILAGAQERELLRAAHDVGLLLGRRVYEDEWVSLVLTPDFSVEPKGRE